MIRVDRNKIKILKNNNKRNTESAEMSDSERMSFVWELTKEVCSLSGKYDVESRLQRNALTIIKK